MDDSDDLLQKIFPTDDLIMQRAGTPADVPGQQDDLTQDPDPQKQESLDQEIAAHLKSIRESLAEE